MFRPVGGKMGPRRSTPSQLGFVNKRAWIAAAEAAAAKTTDVRTTWGTAHDAEPLERLFDELFPLCRSITGPGIRASLAILGRHMPLVIEEVASGTEVFDWTVPRMDLAAGPAHGPRWHAGGRCRHSRTCTW